MSDYLTRIVFMGTPDFSVPTLKALIDAGPAKGWEVVAVYTQPDRRSGRGKKLVASPVKQVAEEHNILVIQPENLRKDPDAVAVLEGLAPDLAVVAAYGMILPATLLTIPNFGCINVHASLLPAYRGASPINAAILHGLEETGTSIMVMDEGLDTGPVLAQETEPIRASDTAVELTERLSHQGARLLVETLPEWLAGGLRPIPQDELAGEPSVCRIIKKSAGQIDWSMSAEAIERMTRAYYPWPSAFTSWNGEPFKIIRARAVDGVAQPGLVVEVDSIESTAVVPSSDDLQAGPDSGGVAVGCGQGLLLLNLVQPAGKRPMDAKSFINGRPEFLGSLLS